MKETSFVVLDFEDNVNSGLYTVKGRRLLQATADFEVGWKSASMALKEAIADLEAQGNKDVRDNRDLGLMGEGGQSDELCNFIQGLQKGNAAMYAECAAE